LSVVAETSLPVEKAQRIAAFRAALRTFLRRTEEVARRCDLTPQRYLLLLMVKGAPDGSERLRLTDLAYLLKIGRNTATELVARAEDAGLVRREDDARDRRVVLLALTEDGEHRLTRAVEENEQHRRELAQAFAVLAETFREAGRV
jgi:DNA-binding MarR family transcriptional regulator